MPKHCSICGCKINNQNGTWCTGYVNGKKNIYFKSPCKKCHYLKYRKPKIKQQYKEHKDKYRNAMYKYNAKRLKTDNNYRTNKYFRYYLWKILKSRCSIGEKSIFYRFLGCTLEQLKNHIEKLFLKGMNWDNYGHGGWTIDHIEPCCNFNALNTSDMYLCHNYKNLRPLWEQDNKNFGYNKKNFKNRRKYVN